jgi:hypothetical protein
MSEKWEYKVLVLDRDEETSAVRLNNFGSAGWELVGVGGRYETAQYAYLKRAIRQQKTST